eukprot:scaffold120320_cov33-Tisochrysis_lutea.AAC.2
MAHDVGRGLAHVSPEQQLRPLLRFSLNRKSTIHRRPQSRRQDVRHGLPRARRGRPKLMKS